MAFLCVLSLAIGVSAQTPAPTRTPLPNSMVAYYPFNGDTLDYSGNGYNASNAGPTLATFIPGVKGQALLFNGKDSYVSAPVNISSDVMPQVTLTCWARADTMASSGTIISQDNGGFKREIDIDTRGGGTGWSAFAGSGSVLGFRPVNVGEWVFLAAVYDQTAKKVTLYVNDAVFQKDATVDPGWNYINIGRNSSFGEYFTGAIQEVRVYNYALSAGEITSLRTGGGLVTPPPTVTTQPGNAAAALTRVDFGQDRVSTSGPNPDGTPDGHFMVNLNVNGSKTIQTVALYTTDSSGNPAGGQEWISTAAGYWFLGVYRSGAVLRACENIPFLIFNQDNQV